MYLFQKNVIVCYTMFNNQTSPRYGSLRSLEITSSWQAILSKKLESKIIGQCTVARKQLLSSVTLNETMSATGRCLVVFYRAIKVGKIGNCNSWKFVIQINICKINVHISVYRSYENQLPIQVAEVTTRER